MSPDTAGTTEPTLARRLGPFDATMIVMGGIIGAGIFVNPSVVARQVHTPALVIGAWIVGGAIALEKQSSAAAKYMLQQIKPR